MSDQSGRRRDPTPDRDPAVTAFLLFVGILLLVPGVCSVIFFPMFFSGNVGTNPLTSGLFIIWSIGALLGVGGIVLMTFVARRFLASRR
jgi:hypothetical protein